MRRAARVLAALACGISQARSAQLPLARPCCRVLLLLAAPFLTRWCRPRAGQTAITDATIWTAVAECRDESGSYVDYVDSSTPWGWTSTFDCPASQATYGPIEDWDVGAVTSLNTWGAGCTENADYNCGRASPIRFDVA